MQNHSTYCSISMLLPVIPGSGGDRVPMASGTICPPTWLSQLAIAVTAAAVTSRADTTYTTRLNSGTLH